MIRVVALGNETTENRNGYSYFISSYKIVSADGNIGITWILVDGTALNEVIIPLMNVSRRCANGEVDADETLNKSQVYITTAGWKNTFAGLKGVIGEVKPHEPIKMGCDRNVANSESRKVTLCQAA